MIINRHIKHWFRHYDNDFAFCEDCKALPSHMEISDDSGNEFPLGTKNLIHISDLELPYTCDGSFMQCYKCNAYYWYRSFAPGGSEDAMRTVNYETLTKTGLLGVYMELTEAIESWDEYCKKELSDLLYTTYRKKYNLLVKQSQIHFNYINQLSDTLIKDTLICLSTNASQKDNKYYRADLIPAEEHATKILIQFLAKVKDKKRFIKNLKPLEFHGNQKVGTLVKKYIES
jgi:hypothetical protein